MLYLIFNICLLTHLSSNNFLPLQKFSGENPASSGREQIPISHPPPLGCQGCPLAQLYSCFPCKIFGPDKNPDHVNILFSTSSIIVTHCHNTTFSHPAVISPLLCSHYRLQSPCYPMPCRLLLEPWSMWWLMTSYQRHTHGEQKTTLIINVFIRLVHVSLMWGHGPMPWAIYRKLGNFRCLDTFVVSRSYEN